MTINKNDLVLEIGSGNRPYPRANILCDRYREKTYHRQPKSQIVIDRPFVIADAERLPFKNKSFDYIIASHIIEHLDHPDQFLNEIQRVGKSGFLAFPKPLLERFYKNAPHKWYCDWDGKVLTLYKKTDKNRRKLPTEVQDKKFEQIMRFFPQETHCSFEWKDKIQYKIFSSEPKNFLNVQDKKISYFMNSKLELTIKTPSTTLLKWKDKLFPLKLHSMRFVERQYYKLNTRTPNLFSVLCCPYCLGKLTIIQNKSIHCQKCFRDYQLLKGPIPKML